MPQRISEAIRHNAVTAGGGAEGWSVWIVRRGYFYTIRPGDVFEYDQYLDPAPGASMVGGADFFYSNEFRFSLAGIADQFGNAPIADAGLKQWVRRRFDVSPLAGQTLTSLVSQINGLGSIGARYANVSIVNPTSHTRYPLYTHGAVAAARAYSDSNVVDVEVDATPNPAE